MRKGYLLWFFTLLCLQLALYGLSLYEVHTLENKDPQVSKHPLVAQEKLGTYGSSGSSNVNLDTEANGENLETKDQTPVTEKAQKGKGSYGGANVVHHPKPTQKAAASVLESPFCFALLLILPRLIA